MALIIAAASIPVGYYVKQWVEGSPSPSGGVSVGEVDQMTRRMFYGKATKQTPGELLGLSIDLDRKTENAGSNSCRLRWTIFDADDSTQVDDPTLLEQPPRDFIGGPQRCNGEAHLWVPLKSSLVKYDRILVKLRFFSGKHEFPTAKTEPQTIG